MSFYICHCGNTQNNHNFRHPYQNIANVKRDTYDTFKECFFINANDFPIKTNTRCAKPNCSANISLHGTEIIPHQYEPLEYKYRHINLTLPNDTMCNEKKCKQLKDHENVITHHFTTKVFIENLNENDIVMIHDPKDEDIKIIWK